MSIQCDSKVTKISNRSQRPVRSLVLRQLQWLPLRDASQRVDFNVATLVYWSLAGISPSYDCCLVADALERRLHTCTFHSKPNRPCDAVIEHLQRLDSDYGTVFYSPVKEADLSYNRFRRSLKTFLFRQCMGPRRSVDYFNSAVYK